MKYRMTAEACCSDLQIAYPLYHVPQRMLDLWEALESLEKVPRVHREDLMEGKELEQVGCQTQHSMIAGEPSTYQGECPRYLTSRLLVSAVVSY